ncbi:MAG: OmpA family protein [Kofleriaceae bacterium]|nr:OmpA family protein [Kofleriaceae bacterium]MBP9204516.1 OmpA family protein [Kofleriaceae bacterium]
MSPRRPYLRTALRLRPRPWQLLAAVVAASGGAVGPARADGTSGIDVALYRAAYDTSGIYTLEGARLMPLHELSWKLQTSYARSPVDVSIPGIGGAVGDTSADSVLGYLVTVDMAFGLTLSDRVGIGLDVAAYRTSTAEGFGERGRFFPAGSTRSTGLIALRPLSNIDPSGGFSPDGLAGPLDLRAGAKLALVRGPRLAVSLVGTVALPFGEDEMLLGDRQIMVEPRLAVDLRRDRVTASKLVLNLGARLRQRTVLEGYDTLDAMATADDARVVLDVGSEALLGVGGRFQLTPRATLGAEATLFYPLPAAASFGRCVRASGEACAELTASDYWGDAGRGDPTVLSALGLDLRLNPHVTGSVQAGAGFLGARGDDLRLTVGVIWSPQPAGVVAAGAGDRDGDGVPDVADACVEEAEDGDGYQDDDGCPDLDNDGDGVADGEDRCVDQAEDRDGRDDGDGCPDLDNDGDGQPDGADRCPDQAEDTDGFEDSDGCPDEDNDGDGFADGVDKCPNDQETVNGVDDTDGCPDARGAAGPEERADRIDLRGGRIDFVGRSANLTGPSKQLLGQVAALIKDKGLAVRVEVHVALGTKSTAARAIATQKGKDKDLATRRALTILEYLVGQGAPVARLQAVGLGADRPLTGTAATDASNERVDFVKTQQRSP